MTISLRTESIHGQLRRKPNQLLAAGWVSLVIIYGCFFLGGRFHYIQACIGYSYLF